MYDGCNLRVRRPDDGCLATDLLEVVRYVSTLSSSRASPILLCRGGGTLAVLPPGATVRLGHAAQRAGRESGKGRAGQND